MRRARPAGRRACRERGVTSRLAAEAVARGPPSLRDYLHSRPATPSSRRSPGRSRSPRRRDARCTSCMSRAGSGVALVVEARARGVDVSCETCPHYLALDEEDAVAIGMVAKCSPPLRQRRDVEDLWQTLLAGRVALVASDHSPSPPGLRRVRTHSLPGAASRPARRSSALLLDRGPAARARPRADRGLASASRTALPPRRQGVVGLGADADLALVDLEHEAVLTEDELLSRHRLEPVRRAGAAGAGRANDRTRLDCLARGRYGRPTGGPARTTGAPSVDGGEVGGVNVTVPGGTARKENRV